MVSGENKMDKVILLFVFLQSCFNFINAAAKPNIIFILADDMGWNDVSFNGMNEIKTPNIDSLAADGMVLHQYYTQAICTPSRSALMTGLYPIRTGLQSLPLLEGQPAGVPLQYTLLPQRLKNIGYTTRAIGKWHLGFHKRAFTPIYRGFDSHFGYWGGVVDYYQHTAPTQFSDAMSCNVPLSERNHSHFFMGYELYDNMIPSPKYSGRHLTEVLTERAVEIIKTHDKSKPLFLYLSHISVHSPPATTFLISPRKLTRQFDYISEKMRRNFAGELTALDEAVGDVMVALLNANMLNNTLVIFTSDNGGGNTIFPNGGSNFPLRGTKISCFDGGNRVPGLVWSPLIKNRAKVSNELFHITDWLPTFYRAGGGNVKDLGTIDGIDQWDTLIEGKPSKRTEFLVNNDPNFGTSGIRVGNYKLILGRNMQLNVENWFGPTGRINFTPNVNYNNKVEKVLRRFHGRNVNVVPNVPQVDCGGKAPNYDSKECSVSPCLYDMVNDPCEYKDISSQYPEKTQELMQKLEKYIQETIPVQKRIVDYNSDPFRHCGLWTTWLDLENNSTTCQV